MVLQEVGPKAETELPVKLDAMEAVMVVEKEVSMPVLVVEPVDDVDDDRLDVKDRQ